MGGLRALERLEVNAVGLKLSVIGGLFAALVLSALLVIASGSYSWPALSHTQGAREFRILLGLVILVQGFETSRYLGAEYGINERIRTMRWAQWISTGIYVVFILLLMPLLTKEIPVEGGETAIIDLLAPIGAAVGPVIIIAALASQSSAAIADLNGAGGLLAEASGRRLSLNLGNLTAAAAAIAITWLSNIYEIITYASKAFVAYYALQSLQAAISAYGQRRIGLVIVYLTGVLIAVAAILFAVPAQA